MDFIFNPEEKRNTNVELEETFLPAEKEDGDNNNPMVLVQKIKHEIKEGQHTQHEAIRHNMVNVLLEYISDIEIGNGRLPVDMGFMEEIAYNTMFNYGFLKEI